MSLSKPNEESSKKTGTNSQSKQSGEYHVIKRPLLVNPREASIIDQQLYYTGMLRNASIRDLRERVRKMREAPEWYTARSLPVGKKQVVYRRMIKKYELTRFDTNQHVLKHWRDSKWMGDRLGSRIGQALAGELHQNIMEWVYGRAEKPRTNHPGARNTVWNNDDKSGLLYRDKKIQWSFNTKCKNLSIPIDYTGWSNKRYTWLQGKINQGKLARAGITREEVRGQTRYFALLCVKSKPYRNQDYLDTISMSVQGLDLGPSQVALVNEQEGMIIPLITEEGLNLARKQAKHERRVKRALDRSRRAMNPEAFDKDGTSKRGVSQSKKSNRGNHKEQSLKTIQRKNKIHRKQEQHALVHQIMMTGARVAAEDLNYQSWQAGGLGLGKHMGLTAPGQFMSILEDECDLVGGGLYEINPWVYALSQYCLCGSKVKKDLSVRVHDCPECGFGPVDRDLFSAFLVREIRVNDLTIKDLSNGVLDKTGFRKRALQACKVPEYCHYSEEHDPHAHSMKKYETSSCSSGRLSKSISEQPGSVLNVTALKIVSDSSITDPVLVAVDIEASGTTEQYSVPHNDPTASPEQEEHYEVLDYLPSTQSYPLLPSSTQEDMSFDVCHPDEQPVGDRSGSSTSGQGQSA